MIDWYCIDSTAYHISKNSNSLNNTMLCFIKDTNELYIGANRFDQAVVLYENLLPSAGTLGLIYIDSNTLEGRIWTGVKWVNVINPIKPSIDSYGGEIVKKIVNALLTSDELKYTVKSVSYIFNSNTFYVECMDTKIHQLPMANIIIEIKYNKESNRISLISANAIFVHNGAVLDISKNVYDLYHNEISDYISIKFDGDNSDILQFDASNILRNFNYDYSIFLIVTGNRSVAESVLTRTGSDPIIIFNIPNNIYISAIGVCNTDYSASNENSAIAFSLNNNISAVSEEENSISEVSNQTGSSIQNKMSKVDPSKVGQVIRISSTGDSEASGYTIGGSVLDGSDTKLAREDATIKYITNNTISKASIVSKDEFISKDNDDTSDSKVASEKAVMDVLTLKTNI